MANFTTNSYTNRNARPNQSHNRRPQGNSNLDFTSIQRIERPLSLYYAENQDTYLIDGPLYRTAASIKSLSSSQLRKVLNLTKEALAIVKHSEQDFDKAKTRLFMLLPMMAYNTGRASNKEKEIFNHLLAFIYRNVSPESIQSPSDIQVFDQVITSVVAYHKLLGGK